MLRITPVQEGTVLRLEGKLSGPWVAEAARACAESRAQRPEGTLTLDLECVSFVDEAGEALLAQLHQEGIGLVGSGPLVGPLLRTLKGGLLLLALASPLAADDAPRRLSLREAIQVAFEQNPKVQMAVLAAAQAQEDRKEAAGALMPVVQGEVDRQKVKMNLDTFMGMPSPHGPVAIGPFTMGEAAIRMQAPILDLSLWKRWQATRAAERGAQAQVLATRESMAALVVGQYLQALRSREAMLAATSRIELARALATYARNQQDQGVGTRLDTLRAEVHLKNEQTRELQTRTQYRTALAGLVRLLDLTPGTSLELTDTLQAPQLPAQTFQEAYTAGLTHRPEFKALDAREEAAQRIQEAARSYHLPTLVSTASIGATGLAGQPNLHVYSLGLALKVPLFTGFRTQAAVAKARLELDRTATDRREAKARLGMDVQVALDSLQTAQAEVETAQSTVTLATEALTQTRHRFEAGVGTHLEVTSAQDDLAKAQDTHIAALHRLNQARADLAFATGTLLEQHGLATPRP